MARNIEMSRFRKLLKTTAVRLSIIYLLLFSVLALGLVFYVSYNTGRLIISQVQAAAEDEVRELAEVYRSGGPRTLIRSIERRSRNPGANLYLVSEQTGRIITGNVKSVEPKYLKQVGWNSIPFPYETFNDESDGPHRAIAHVFSLPGGLRLLVGRDIGDAVRFRGIVVQAAGIALTAMLITGILLWLLIGRRALKRVDDVSKASERILAGDLAERLPISGSSDEFDRLSQNLNAMIARVETLNSGVREVSDAIAHDLKTPLARLRNEAEKGLNSAKSKSSTEAKSLSNVLEQADGLIRTFDALLMISQLNSGARTVDLERVDLRMVIEDVFELFEPAMEEKGVELKLAESTTAMVMGNRELLAQTFTNLIENALKYGSTSEDPVIEIGVKKQGNNVVAFVCDNGDGIPENARESVKERFFRLDKSRSRSGSGLGLALVDGIVKLHGGKFELVDNKPGLRAVVRLPSE